MLLLLAASSTASPHHHPAAAATTASAAAAAGAAAVVCALCSGPRAVYTRGSCRVGPCAGISSFGRAAGADSGHALNLPRYARFSFGGLCAALRLGFSQHDQPTKLRSESERQ